MLPTHNNNRNLTSADPKVTPPDIPNMDLFFFWLQFFLPAIKKVINIAFILLHCIKNHTFCFVFISFWGDSHFIS